MAVGRLAKPETAAQILTWNGECPKRWYLDVLVGANVGVQRS
jgi:hypothetical protein